MAAVLLALPALVTGLVLGLFVGAKMVEPLRDVCWGDRFLVHSRGLPIQNQRHPDVYSYQRCCP